MSAPNFAELDGFIWMNGETVDWKEAKIHFLTHSLHYGSAVFEGIGVYSGKPFKLTEHIERLIEGSNALDLEINYSVEELKQACLDNIKANKIVNGYIRPLTWRGSDNMGITAKGVGTNVGIASWEWPKSYFAGDAKEKGISLKTATWRRPDPKTAPCHVKANGLYMICTMSKHEAENAGYDEALMLDYRGHVAELSSANFFIVKDGELHTPTPDCFLNGITRQTIIKLAEDMDIKVNVRTILPEELKDADECFATGTAVEIMPISKIDDKTYPVGPITKDLLKAYHNTIHA